MKLKITHQCPHCHAEINPAEMLRAIPSKDRIEASRANGRKSRAKSWATRRALYGKNGMKNK